LIGIAPIFAVWPLNSCHAAHRIQRKSARYALKFVRRAVMSAPNTKWSIVSNAPKPAINVSKNAGKWQRNNNDHPILAVVGITNKGD
jgi:hypothetical protein